MLRRNGVTVRDTTAVRMQFRLPAVLQTHMQPRAHARQAGQRQTQGHVARNDLPRMPHQKHSAL